MLKVLAILMLMIVPALAQQPREYTIKLPADMLNQVGAGLDELPGHIRRPIIDAISKQIAEQNAAMAEKEKAEAKKPNE
jgi:hypothetical protein